MNHKAPTPSRGKPSRNRGAWAAALIFRLLFCSLGLTGLSVTELSAQTNVVKKPVSDNRYLVILDTSRGMQRRSEGTLKAVQELLKSSFDDQVRQGDTIGLWTFNDQLHAGQFPLQQWSAETRSGIEERIFNFVGTQRYEKGAAIDRVISAMQQVIRNSDLITIFLISDGQSKIRGTIFDDQINQAYEKWREEQRKANMPLVTMLRAKSGKLMHFSVTPGQWPVELPPLPPPPPVVLSKPVPEIAQKKVLPAPPPAIVPSLIIRGKRPEPTELAVSPENAAGNALSNAGVEPDKANLTASTLPVDSKVVETARANQPGVNNRNETQSKSATDTKNSKDTGQQLAQSSGTAPTSPARPVEESVSQSSAAPQVAVAPGFFGNRSVWIVGLVLLGSACGLILLAVRRGKSSSPQISLITRSLEKEHRK